jgi:hypothetical protein
VLNQEFKIISIIQHNSAKVVNVLIMVFLISWVGTSQLVTQCLKCVETMLK